MRFPSGMRRYFGVIALGLVASALLSACGTSPSVLSPSGPIADKEAWIFWFILVVATIIFVGVTSVLLYSVFRFRDRPGAPEARQFHGNTTLEIVWTIVPSLLLFVILAVTVGTMFAIASPPTPATITVNAIGHQWWWEFQYPDSKVVTADELHVPVGAVVHVNLISDNVIHSFWIPQLAGKTDVIPGHDNSMWFQATATGQYRGECAEFCGTQHAHMDFVVVVQPMADYTTWIAQQQSGAAKPLANTPEAAGQHVFLTSGCVSCHVISGVANIGKVHIGPDLTHFGSRLWIAGGVLDNNPQNLQDWILHAQTVKSGVDMPSFDGSSPGTQALSSVQINELVAYLESLK